MEFAFLFIDLVFLGVRLDLGWRSFLMLVVLELSLQGRETILMRVHDYSFLLCVAFFCCCSCVPRRLCSVVVVAFLNTLFKL